MAQKILKQVQELNDKMIARRRDLHKYPEAGWTEFRTAAIVAEVLTSFGYQVSVGADVIDEASMMGVPGADELEEHMQRAVSQGAKVEWVEKMRGGKTGVVGVMDFGRPGPTLALRFDLDANDAIEAKDEAHRPYAEGFSSVNHGVMHACGHDGHVAVGLTLAEIIANRKEELSGRVKFIFQPAEEGVRGAKAMVQKGIVDDVDYFLGMHFGFMMKKTGALTCNVKGFLATTKLDAQFTGVAAHAGAAPETGHNALLAAAAASLHLHGISRHGKGTSRINVGVLQAGTGRNVIPANALIKLETRGATSEINGYMHQEAVRIIESAAVMHKVSVQISEAGGAVGAANSPAMVSVAEKLARESGLFDEITKECDFNASEDCSYFMERVQRRGGEAAYLMVGATLAAGHHDFRFDFDEAALLNGAVLVGSVALDYLKPAMLS